MELKIWQDPQTSEVGDTPEDFLHILGGATALRLTGKDRSRTRVLVTLTHGNEPSGFRAVHRWLAEGHRQPAVNIVVILSAVETALTRPFFFYRHLPGRRDLNRCFRPPYEGREGRLAAAILTEIRHHHPEAVVDMHNTSGSSHAFAVVHRDSFAKRQLASLFVDCLIDSRLCLGALMEQDQQLGVPIITIEAGGVQDPQTTADTWRGVETYFLKDNLYKSSRDIFVFNNPLRLELAPKTSIDYADRRMPETNVVMRKDIEKFNFYPIDKDEMLGWLNIRGIAGLKVIKENTTRDANEFFKLKEGKFYPRHKMQIFMATTQRNIAVSDCLFYFINS